MIITEPNLLKDIKAGVANPVEVEKYLLNNFSAPALAHELADYILEAQATQKIVIPLDQFLSHFRSLPAGKKKFGLTAGLPVNLEGLVGADGTVWGLESFGFSAPYKVLDEKLGFTGQNVYDQVKALLK